MLNIRIIILVSVLGLIFILSSNCASRTIYVVKSPPVKKVTVVKTPAPYPNSIWVNRHWTWRGGKYVWVNGYWVKPRRGQVWMQGYWIKKPRGWVWVQRHWVRIR